jgi:hypothetical protein
MENTDPLALVAALLAIGWLIYFAMARCEIDTLRGIIKSLEDKNLRLQKQLETKSDEEDQE